MYACMNGAVCNDQPGDTGRTCSCPSEWTGDTCDILVISSCKKNPALFRFKFWIVEKMPVFGQFIYPHLPTSTKATIFLAQLPKTALCSCFWDCTRPPKTCAGHVIKTLFFLKHKTSKKIVFFLNCFHVWQYIIYNNQPEIIKKFQRYCRIHCFLIERSHDFKK